MSPWVGLDIGVFVLGLVCLGLVAWRLWRQVRGFGRSVSAAAQRIGDAQSALDRIAAERSPGVARDIDWSGPVPSEGARHG